VSPEKHYSRRNALRTLGGVAVVGLAGCNATPPDGAAAQSAGTSTETTTESTTETTTESTTDEEMTQTSERASSEAPASVEFAENPEEIHPILVEETSAPSDKVLLGFRLEDSSLPFETEVYHAPADATVGATETYDTQDLGQVGLVPENPQALDTVDTPREDIHYGTTAIGDLLTVTLVARHDGESFEWSAWERTGYPYAGFNESNPALEVDCYCGGMMYTAPGGGTWARVIQVTPTARVDPGSTIVLNWTSSRT